MTKTFATSSNVGLWATGSMRLRFVVGWSK
jgi:hypothetical protein